MTTDDYGDFSTLLAVVRRQEAALTAVREMHVNDMSGAGYPAPPGMCEVCMWAWPCPTVRAISYALASLGSPDNQQAAVSGSVTRTAQRADPAPEPVAHNHTRFRNDAGPWSPCPVSCPAAGLLR